MKEFNPFQVPGSAIGTLQIQNHRRERFRNIFFAVLAAHVALFLTLLIQGCRSQTTSQAPQTSETTTIAPQH